MWSFVRPIFKQLNPCFTQDTELWYPILSNKERTLLFFPYPFTKLSLETNLKNEKTVLSFSIAVVIYLPKVNNRNTRTMWEISLRLTIKTPERRRWRRSSVFIVNFEQISHTVLVFLLLYWTSNCQLEYVQNIHYVIYRNFT